MAPDRQEIERFVYLEARLMDGHCYDEWLALWDEDATYWVPCGDPESEPSQTVSVIYDRRGQLRNRIVRLKETLWLKEQAPRLKRLVANIEVAEPGAEGAGAAEVVVNSSFILAELHRHRQTLWVGSTLHRLVPRAGGLAIKYKKVTLLNHDEPLPNMLFLI
jgi:3-phenylpropionate/cinnamic acid dioxygenase small subunit